MRLPPACSTYFFQKFTGYNEQTMYVSSSLLMWIGFLLPFSGCERKGLEKDCRIYGNHVYCAVYFV